MAIQLNHKIIGTGTPVLILHGLFGMLDNLLSLAKYLESKGYMAILVDQRDHGRSPHTSSFDYDLLSEDLFNFCEDLGIYKTHLIGHSMGGKTILKFASKYDSYVDKMIVIDMGIKRYIGNHQPIFDALLSLDLSQISSRSEVQDILTKKLNDEGTVLFLMKNLSRTSEGNYEWKMNLPLLHKNYTHILDQIHLDHPIDIHSLFIRGANSDYIEDDDISDIKNYFPNSSFESIEGAGHWVHVDRPEELYAKINAFLDH